MHKNEKHGFKILLTLASVLSIAPCYKSIKGDISRPRFLPKFTAGFLITAYVLSLIGNTRGNYPLMSVPQMFVDIISSLMRIILAVTIVILSQFHYTDWRDLFISLQEVTVNIDCKEPCPHTNARKILIEVILIHVAVILKFAWNCVVWTYNVGFQLFSYYIFRDIAEYYCSVCFFLLLHLILVINHRYKHLNNKLKASISDSKCKNVTTISAWSDINCTRSIMEYDDGLKKLQRNYRKLGKVVEVISKIFGYQILLLLSTGVVILLEALQVGLSHPNLLIFSYSVISTTHIMVSSFLYKSINRVSHTRVFLS